MAGPPVAIVRSHCAISSFASGMLGRSTTCSTSSGTPSFARAARMIRTVSMVVLRLAGCGEKIDRVLALDRVDRDPDRCDVRAGDGDQRGDDARRLRVLDDAARRILLDDRPCSSGAARRGGFPALSRAASARGGPCRSRPRSCWRAAWRSPRCRRPTRRRGTGDRPRPDRSPRWRPSPRARARPAPGRPAFLRP